MKARVIKTGIAVQAFTVGLLLPSCAAQKQAGVPERAMSLREWDFQQEILPLEMLMNDPHGPGLTRLRVENRLEQLVAGALNDWERLRRIVGWANAQFQHGNDEASKSDPLTILNEAAQGKKMRCVEYGYLVAGAARALGMPARMLGLMRDDVETAESGAGHVAAEVWLPKHQKWAFDDGQFGVIVERDGVPLNAIEFRDAIARKLPGLQVLAGSEDEQKKVDQEGYIRWLAPYLYYFNVGSDQRFFGTRFRALQTSYILGPKGAPQPRKFQGQPAFTDHIYISNPKAVYPMISPSSDSSSTKMSDQEGLASYMDLKPGAFLTRWLVCGPFPVPGLDVNSQDATARERAFDRDFLAGQGGEEKIRPHPGTVHEHGKNEYRWQFHASEGDAVDLGDLYGAKSHCLAYAWAEIEMSEARTVVLGIGSDDAIKVWLNGRLVHRNWIDRYLGADDDLVSVNVQAGPNRLLVKVQNRDGGWGFACRALDSRTLGDKLLATAQKGDLAGVKQLVSYGADLNAKDRQGFTAWHLAQLWGHREVSQCLLKAGADLTVSIPTVGTPEGILDLLWRTLKENHPGMELLGAIDDSWYDNCKAKLAPLSTLNEVLPVIDTMIVKRLRDFHTGLHWPGKSVLVVPPLELGFIEEEIVVTRCGAAGGPSPGDIVLEVDGQEARKRFEAELSKVFGATQHERVRSACNALIQGPRGSPVKLKLQDAGGLSREITLERASSGFGRDGHVITGRDLDERTGYIRISQWMGWPIESFDTLLEQMRDKPKLIIDVRENGGGQDRLADMVIGRFLSHDVLTSVAFRRVPKSNEYIKMVYLTKPRGPWRYEGQTAVLFDEACHSACEHFLAGMQLAGAALVGRPTSGGCGGVERIDLPLGITLYCSKAISLHGDRAPLGGIEPHHFVEPTIQDLRQGHDAFLEKAVAVLQ